MGRATTGCRGISRRQVLRGAALGGLVGAGGGALGFWSGLESLFSRRKGGNLIVISIDSLRADHLRCYGYYRQTSPRMDALARAGVRWADAESVTSWTTPAHLSLLTSLYPIRHGVIAFRRRLDRARTTLADVLKGHGYATAAVVSSATMHTAFGFSKGFDLYYNTSRFDPGQWVGGNRTFPSSKQLDKAHGEVTSEVVSKLAIDWIKRHSKQKFFLFLHYWDVHYDYMPPPPWDTFFDPGYKGRMNFRNFASNDGINRDMSWPDLQHLIGLYDGEIRHSDTHIGVLLDELERMGLTDETLVVLTADHGDEFFEHGEKGHHRTLFREVLHVPLIMSWPGRLPADRTLSPPVSLVDVMPTVLGVMGIEQPAETDGQDLSPLLRGESMPLRPLRYSELFMGKLGNLYAVQGRGWKVIVDLKGKQLSVYHLSKDPGEQRPLHERNAPQFAEAVAASRQLRSRLAEAAENMPKLGPVTTQPMDHRSLESLRSLGYIK